MIRVVFLAGKLDATSARDLARKQDRLGALGVVSKIICLSAGPLVGLPGVQEAPGLGDFWRRPLSIRDLDLRSDDVRPDLIHILDSGLAGVGLALAERWRMPYCLSVDEFLPSGSTLRVSKRWCRAIIASGPDLAADLERSMHVPQSLIEVITAGFGLPDVSRPVSSVPDRVPVVGTVITHASGGGFPVFLEAARLVLEQGADVEFVARIADGHDAEWRRLALHLGIDQLLTFADETGEHDAFWEVLDVYAQPSLVPSTGRSLAQAMARGVPVIASDVDGLRAWIEPNVDGLIVPSGLPGPLAEATRRLLDDRLLGRRLGERARERIGQRCDPDQEAGSLLALYQRVSEWRPRAGETAPVGTSSPTESPGS